MDERTTIKLPQKTQKLLEAMRKADFERALAKGCTDEALSIDYGNLSSYVSTLIAKEAIRLGVLKKPEVKK